MWIGEFALATKKEWKGLEGMNHDVFVDSKRASPVDAQWFHQVFIPFYMCNM